MNQRNKRKDEIRIYGIDPSFDKSLIDHLNKIIFNSESGVQIPNELRNYFKNLKFENLIDVSTYQRNSIKSRLIDLKKIIPVGNHVEYALAIEQFLQALKRLEVPVSSLRSLNIRDSSMAKNVEQIISSDTVRYNIIFAHNEHLSINPSNGIVSMGSFLNNTLKENYYPITVDFIEGEYRVNKGVSTATFHSENNDKWLGQIIVNKIDAVYTMTNDKYFDRKINLHAIGGGVHSTKFKSHNLMNDYRAIILFKHGTASEQID